MDWGAYLAAQLGGGFPTGSDRPNDGFRLLGFDTGVFEGAGRAEGVEVGRVHIINQRSGRQPFPPGQSSSSRFV